MTAAKRRDHELLTVLACEIEARPAGPAPGELAPYVKAAYVHPDALVLELDDAGDSIAQAFVAAEQVCCSSIGWELDRTAGLKLRITASEPQLRVLAGLVPSNLYIERIQ